MIRTVFTYSLFTIAFILVSFTFVTAANISQLAVAIAAYPLLALFAYKAFPHFWGHYSRKPEELIIAQEKNEKTQEITKEEITITDVNKRTFLKLIGATSLSFFLISVFGRKLETSLLGKANVVTIPPADEYKISGVDYNEDSYFGYVKKGGGWYIIKGDPEKRSFLYVKGDSKFPHNWENRENLRYDYFNNVFKS